MAIADIILLVIVTLFFIPFVLLMVGGTVILANELMLEVKESLSKNKST